MKKISLISKLNNVFRKIFSVLLLLCLVFSVFGQSAGSTNEPRHLWANEPFSVYSPNS